MHYTTLGLEKLRRQAEADQALVRCPRDGAVMRVLGGWATRRDHTDETKRFTVRLPDRARWRIRELDLECPACRRRATGIRMAESGTEPIQSFSALRPATS